MRNIAQIVISNKENDKSISVDNDAQLEIPSEGVAFLTKLTYSVRNGISLTEKVQHVTICPLDTWTGPSLIDEGYFKHQCKSCMKCLELPKLRMATKGTIIVEGIIPLKVQMGDLQVRTFFGVVKSLKANNLKPRVSANAFEKFSLSQARQYWYKRHHLQS